MWAVFGDEPETAVFCQSLDVCLLAKGKYV
jgi:hypothetical protein